MPLSTLDGEPSTEVHEHYDADGNLTGSTVVTRPGWSETNRAWALGLALYESVRCPRGHDLTDSLDVDEDGDQRWRFVADPPLVCLACVALDAEVKRTQKDPYHGAMLHHVRKVPRQKPAERRKRRR